MSTRFGDMLLERRRQMGLSIQQVANTIKIRPQIIEFFEMGDFASMPPRGYAQGLIASYARFLGLNPRQVVDAYYNDLSAYERHAGTSAGTLSSAASEASPHGDDDSGRFLMVDPMRRSRYGQRPPQAGYVSDATSPHMSRSAEGMRRAASPTRYSQGRGRSLPAGASDADVTGRIPAQGGRPAARPGYGSVRTASAGSAAARGFRVAGSSPASSGTGSRALGSSRAAAGRGSVPPRGRGQGNRGGAGAPAGSRGYGRSSSGVPRRQGMGGSRSRSASGRGARRGGSGAALADPRVVYVGMGMVALLIILVLVLLIRSCSGGSAQPAQSGGTAAVDLTAGSAPVSAGSSTASAAADGSDASGSASSSMDAATQAADATQVSEEELHPTVKVSVASGKTSWVEIKVDGKMVVSESPVGPWEQTYQPTQSIQITVNDPSNVTVEKNGTKVRYDSKSSGVGRVTITVPQQAAADGSSTDSSTGSTDGSSSTSGASTGQSSQGDSSASTTTSQTGAQ